MRLPETDGLRPVRELGGGGRTWLVRETRSGELFVLRLCAPEGSPERQASVAAAQAVATGLARLEADGLVAVRGLLGPAGAPLGLVEDHAPGGSLAERLAARGRLGPEEVAAVLRATAAGLARLHELGRSHGRISARRVVFDAEDRARLAGVTGGGRPEEDVRDLAAVAWAALTGRVPAGNGRRVSLALLCPTAPRRLLRCVEAALAADAAERPSAGELVRVLGDESPAGTPDEPAAGEPAGVPRPARGPGGRRVLLLAGAAGLVAGGAALLAWPEQEAAPPPAAVAPAPQDVPSDAPSGAAAGAPAMEKPAAEERAGQPSEEKSAEEKPAAEAAPVREDPERALRELVARRGQALRTGDLRLLEEVYEPGAALEADRRTVARDRGSGDDPFGELVLEVVAVAPLGPAPAGRDVAAGTTAVYRAEVRMQGYRGTPGPGLAVVPAGNGWVQTVDVVLVADGERWRVREVAPAGEGAPSGSLPATDDPRR
ncbi:hypothetical protein GCM10011374_18460 [Kocuria dechangensis]|uniref:Protein kinase domain-containing protein n=1 Tax=Kocuria dechangensis TaxID=1176249 RepID=A0A917GS64_9MICC|nr:hypothetical protein GCM10011374_18460 [Kocuria dechangensis]